MVDCGKRGLLWVDAGLTWSKRTLGVEYTVFKVVTDGTSYGPNMNTLPGTVETTAEQTGANKNKRANRRRTSKDMKCFHVET